MVYITYSQPKLKEVWNKRIRRIFDVVKTKSTPDLWIKVFFYRDKVHEFGGELKNYPATNWRGHYRWFEFGGHGFYDDEWKFMEKHPKIKHVITLKIGESCDDEDIANLIAHEFRHYLQYSKYGQRMNPKLNGGSRAVQVERDANKWQEQRVNQLISEGKIKHKDTNIGFVFWRFQENFERITQ